MMLILGRIVGAAALVAIVFAAACALGVQANLPPVGGEAAPRATAVPTVAPTAVPPAATAIPATAIPATAVPATAVPAFVENPAACPEAVEIGPWRTTPRGGNTFQLETGNRYVLLDLTPAGGAGERTTILKPGQTVQVTNAIGTGWAFQKICGLELVQEHQRLHAIARKEIIEVLPPELMKQRGLIQLIAGF